MTEKEAQAALAELNSLLDKLDKAKATPRKESIVSEMSKYIKVLSELNTLNGQEIQHQGRTFRHDGTNWRLVDPTDSTKLRGTVKSGSTLEQTLNKLSVQPAPAPSSAATTQPASNTSSTTGTTKQPKPKAPVARGWVLGGDAPTSGQKFTISIPNKSGGMMDTTRVKVLWDATEERFVSPDPKIDRKLKNPEFQKSIQKVTKQMMNQPGFADKINKLGTQAAKINTGLDKMGPLASKGLKAAGTAGSVYGMYAAAENAYQQGLNAAGIAYSAAALLYLASSITTWTNPAIGMGAGAAGFGLDMLASSLASKAEEVEQKGPNELTMAEKNQLRSQIIDAIQRGQKFMQNSDADPATLEALQSTIDKLFKQLRTL